MTRFAILCAAVFVAAPASAQIELQPLPGIDGSSPAVAPAAESARDQVRECAGEKFVFAWGAGARPTKVTLCSEPGATTEDVVRMIEDAAAKIEASAIPEDRRAAITQQMRAKVAELKGELKPPAQAEQAARPPVAPVASPVIAATPPIAAPVRAVPSQVTAASAALPKPRLVFECYTPGELGSGGPCTMLARETRLTVKARDPLPSDSSVRFIRNGEMRGELALGQMRKGQATRLTLPREVCAGVVEAETEIQVVRAGQVLDSAGPYLLRC